MDSPTELADFALREWQVPGPDGKDYTFRLAIHREDDAADIDRFVGMAKAVVAQHNKVFGGPPPLDFGTYTFIADYMPQISGDGMEHRNRSEEHTSELQSLMRNSYAVFCLKTK